MDAWTALAATRRARLEGMSQRATNGDVRHPNMVGINNRGATNFMK
jgi:hypothetical protein